MMKIFVIGLIFGWFIGVVCGIVIIAILQAGKKEDEWIERRFKDDKV